MKPFILFLSIVSLCFMQSCGDDGGGSSSGNGTADQEEDTNDSTNCSFTIKHPFSDGTTIECFSLTTAEADVIIKTELAKKNYNFQNAETSYVYESSPVCVLPEEGAETANAMFSSILDGNGARVYHEGEGSASEWREADTLALRDSLRKIPPCN